MGMNYRFTGKGVERKYTNHQGILHESIEGLGHDWEQVGDPGIAACYPFKIYLPQSTEDVVAAALEAKALGQKLLIRGSGHSSNHLVVSDHCVMLYTARMNRILDINEQDMTATVEAGAIGADVDEALIARGLGLPVIGDHNDITLGGFVSAAGISPASHRVGLFIDNVTALEYVTFDGEVVRLDRKSGAAGMNRILAGTGQHGILTSITTRIIRTEKYRTILKNDIRRFRSIEEFIRVTQEFLNDFGDVQMARGAWFDIPFGRGYRRVGQFSAYRSTPQNGWIRMRNRVAYGLLHQIGQWAGVSPPPLEKLLKVAGLLGLVYSPRYASIKNVESFTDRITNATTGDPTRWFIMLAPSETYSALVDTLYRLALDYRKRLGCFTLVSVYMKGIRSDYLSKGDPAKRFSELTLYVGINLEKMNGGILQDFVSDIDDACIRYGSFRYMHSMTVKDPERRRRIDPNAMY